MFLTSGDFSNNGAAFYDSVENLDLTVETVNAPVNVPEPGSLTLLAVGLVALGLLLSRHAA